jgi:hypothetical protein
VAFWYQIEPHKPWAPMPPASERLPFKDRTLLKGHDAVAHATHSDSPADVQPVGGTTDGKQLWFRPTDDHAWLEIPFELKKDQTVFLFDKMVHSWDYGIYNVLLDGEKVAHLDLYSPDVTPDSHSLGTRHLAAGKHTLRFEGAGKNPKSKGYYLGFDALAERIPVYSRGPDEDLRKLQKPRE